MFCSGFSAGFSGVQFTKLTQGEESLIGHAVVGPGNSLHQFFPAGEVTNFVLRRYIALVFVRRFILGIIIGIIHRSFSPCW